MEMIRDIVREDESFAPVNPIMDCEVSPNEIVTYYGSLDMVTIIWFDVDECVERTAERHKSLTELFVKWLKEQGHIIVSIV